MPAATDVVDPAQRIVEAAARLPGYGGVTGWAALSWLGGVWFSGIGRGGELLPVPVAVSSGNRMRPRAGLDVSQEVIAPRYVVHSGGVRVTHALWSVSFEMRRARDDEAAVAVFDMAAFNDLVSITELAAFVESDLAARRGVERLRRVLPWLDENAWSPMEPVMRLVWREEMHGPRLLSNVPVFDRDGHFVGTPDVIDPAAGVYGMYDGGLHLAGSVRLADVAKEAAYRRVGLEGATMMAGDLADRDPFRGRLREAYVRAGRLPVSDRAWTLQTPSWWRDTTTVDARRLLSAYDRERLLAHRQRAA